jgi:hypothetical protein
MDKNIRMISAGAALRAAIFMLLTKRLSAGDSDEKAEKAIKALGGRSSRNNDSSKAIDMVILTGAMVKDEALKNLAGLKRLRPVPRRFEGDRQRTQGAGWVCKVAFPDP